MSRSEAETIWMSKSAMKKPTHMAAKANTFVVTESSAGFTVTKASIALRGALMRRLVSSAVDLGGDRQARPQATEHRCIAVEYDAHRHALHDFSEIACRILRRQYAKLRARRGRQARHMSPQSFTW